MNLGNNLIINIYSIAILTVICIHCLKQEEKSSLKYRLYMNMLQVTIVMLVLDIFSRFDGNPSTIYLFVNHFGNFMIFMLNPILPTLWLLYVHDQVFQEEEKTRLLYRPLFAINFINAVIVVVMQFYQKFYYIDSDNIYHRGQFFWISVLIVVIFMLVAFFLIIINHKKIEKKHYFSLMFFSVPPFISIMLQIAFYGTSLIYNSVVLSFLIIFLNIQNHNIYTDHLTGVNNRKKLELYLKEKIRTTTVNKTFSAIMIDLNDFKYINDTFGHHMGDDALEASAKLFQSCLKSTDFIARFGGDEFCIVLDISDISGLEKIVCRINRTIKEYNDFDGKPYNISVSMGYAVYDCHSCMTVEEFQKKIDILMYENKKVIV